MSGPVALTGATGFVGGHITDRLMAGGHQVRALTRRPQPDRPGLTWVRGDLADTAALSRLVAGAASVVHCAGAVRGASARHFHRINVDGTQALLDAVLRTVPACRFLLISSLAAREPALSWYADSKRAAELVLERGAPDLQWTAFRPPAVYGPGDRELVPLFRSMRRGWLPTVAPDGARFSLLHVTDLARAVCAWLDVGVRREIFSLDDGTPRGYDWITIRASAQAAFNRPIRRLRLPPALLRGIAWTNLAAARLAQRAPMLTPGKVRELTHVDWVCDNTRIVEYLNWHPDIRLANALARPELTGL
jgi:nucleoside-diphosphate-sugar epimerase